MKSLAQTKPGETRTPFRILAGVVAAVVLIIGFPAAVMETFRTGGWEAAFCGICCVYAGVGLAMGARTGRWYGA